MMKKITIAVTVFFLALSGVNHAYGGGIKIEYSDIEPGDFLTFGFKLDRSTKVYIEAVGAGGEKKISKANQKETDISNMYAYAWIIETATRNVVWKMNAGNTKQFGWSKINRKFDGSLELKAGDYEVYYYSHDDWYHFDSGFITFKKIVEAIFMDEGDIENASKDWKFIISDVDKKYSSSKIKKIRRRYTEEVICNITGVRDSDNEVCGFKIDTPQKVDIYAIGEGFLGKMHDYAWLTNAETHESVWKMEEYKTEHAGGAAKNRQIKASVTLKPGSYLAHYKSDGSHSFRTWNANPPYDIYHYGLIIKAADKDFDYSTIEKFEAPKKNSVVNLTKIGDYAYKEAAFELSQKSQIHIEALGEGRNGDMYDYGWITNAKNGDMVWKMEFEDTRHAGGSSKNRIFDDNITLKKGVYIVHYQSDDSHSYEGWNEAKPQNHRKWGISIYSLGNAKSLNSGKFQNDRILVELVGIGDSEHIKKQFSITEPMTIRVYALGEGTWEDMYDYGWIVNAETGKMVWKMKYSKTNYAGGAKKNRKVNTSITLNPGKYIVHYKSDDSHSTYDWNDDPPRDRGRWGITIYRDK
jgi:hypothetical protein